MSLFDQPKWPIWKVLAWVLTRDQEFTERSSPQDFVPGRADEEYVSDDEVTKAWRLLREGSGRRLHRIAPSCPHM